jgi:predicted dehydrogenase
LSLRVLVVGAGSAGRRHARNLLSLGARVSCFDPRADRIEQARAEQPQLDAGFGDWDAALASPFDAAVVASPPFAHVEQARALLRKGAAVLLEKPVAPDLAAAQRLAATVAEARVPLLLGYTYRWWPPLLELRRRVDAGAVGPLRHARFVMSAHLADWHPWERYQDFFMASREQGGGALLDESHFLDLAAWLFGMPESVQGRAERLSSLEITSDDNVDVLCCYGRTFRVTLHLDLYGRPHERSVTVVGEQGTLQCLFDPNRLRESGSAAGPWNETPFECERNDMFLALAREFLDVAAGRRAPSCTIDDGVRVLRLVEAVRRSTAEGRLVAIDGAGEAA